MSRNADLKLTASRQSTAGHPESRVWVELEDVDLLRTLYCIREKCTPEEWKEWVSAVSQSYAIAEMEM